MTTATITKRERYLQAVAGEALDRPPVWLMRQAGRFMPEYRALREKYSFLELCNNPEAAATASLLPLTLLDVDILIIFNDILIPLQAMGLQVEFDEDGPLVSPRIGARADLERLAIAAFNDPPVAQSIRRLKELAGEDVPVLGFCGAPFTLAAYAAEGRMSRNQHRVKELMYRAPDVMHEVLRRITETAANYLISQIREGRADGVQVFESWGGVLAPKDYEEFALRYQRDLIGRVKAECPETPIHLFVKGCEPHIESMASTKADVLSIDWTMSLSAARRRTGACLQGNLDPVALHVPETMEAQVERMIDGFDWRKGWIANLGHGVLPEASVAGVKAFVGAIQNLASRGSRS